MAKFIPQVKVWETEKVAYAFSMDTFFGDVVLNKLKETPRRICQISVEDDIELSCDELRVKSVRVAHNLTAIGMKPGDVVGIVCRHTHKLTMALYGCILIGAPLNPVDLTFTKNDIKHMFGQTRPKLVICDSDQTTKVQAALRDLDNDVKVYSIRYGETKQELKFEELLTPTGRENDFVAPPFNQRADEKVLLIMCSSGTTG